MGYTKGGRLDELGHPHRREQVTARVMSVLLEQLAKQDQSVVLEVCAFTYQQS